MENRETTEVTCIGRRRIVVGPSAELAGAPPGGLALRIDLERTGGRKNLATLVLEKREAKKLAAAITRTLKRA
jgi:hypothetical protein